jgi:hypothetical protein
VRNKRNRYFVLTLASTTICGLLVSHACASIFNGGPDYQDDSHGYYYAVSGGLFPTGTTPNGDNASGGTFRFVTDEPAWGYPTDAWQKDDWYSDNAGIALTLRNAGSIVYDNNGLEPDAATAADPNYYLTPGHGAVVAYGMSNNFDWIYAGYFKLLTPTTITSLTAYFVYSGLATDPITAGFDPNDPAIAFNMNIWSNVAGDLPKNTGSFNGDVFTSDASPGTFSWSDTGYDRAGTTSHQDIYRLTYDLGSPLTLDAGVYWFSSDAEITPEPTTLLIWGGLALGAFCVARKRRIAEA